MRSLIVILAYLLALVSESWAVLSITVPVDSMSTNSSLVEVDMYVYGNATPYSATTIHVPSGAPLHWIVNFDYDASLNTVSVDSIKALVYCDLNVDVAEECTWIPEPFTVFYQDGVFSLPTPANFHFDSELCNAIDSSELGELISITAGNGAWDQMVTSSSSSGVEILFLQNNFYDKTIIEGGQTWNRLSFGVSGGVVRDTLKAELPIYVVWLDVPDSGTVTLGGLSSATQSYSNRHIYPHQVDSTEFALDTTFYSSNEWYPTQNAWLGTPMIVRHERVVPLAICPFSYNPALDSLKVLTTIYADIVFSSSPGENELRVMPGGGLTQQDTLFYKKFLVNYERDDEMRTDNGAYLGITLDEYEEALDSLLAWKTIQGFETHKVVFTSLPTTEQVRAGFAFSDTSISGSLASTRRETGPDWSDHDQAKTTQPLGGFQSQGGFGGPARG